MVAALQLTLLGAAAAVASAQPPEPRPSGCPTNLTAVRLAGQALNVPDGQR